MLFVLLAGCFQFTMAQDLSLYQKKVYRSKSGQELKYRILYPENYMPGKKYSRFIFLHGAGERGNDNEKQVYAWLRSFSDSVKQGKVSCNSIISAMS